MIKKVASLLIFLYCCQLSAINVIFRLDDPLLMSDSITIRTIQLFRQKQVPLSIAIIPCNKEEEEIIPYEKDSLYLNLLLSQNIEIALHGLTHNDYEGSGEFGGLNEEESSRRITKGKNILCSQLNKDIFTFIPPFNVWNEHTISAMLRNNINIISADLFTPIYADNIHYLPETLGLLMQQKGIWKAAEDAIFDCKAKNAICVVMFHAYDLLDEQSWQDLERLLDQCNESDNIKCHTFQSLVASGVESTKHRYYANQLHSGLQKYLLHPGVLHTTWLCWAVHILNALLYALIPLLLLLGYYKKHRKAYLFTAFIGCVLFFFCALFNIFGPIKLIALDISYIFLMVLGLSIFNKGN